MAKLNFQFSGDEAALATNTFDRQPLPEGEYRVQINDADYRETKNGDGYYVSVEFEVIDGEHASRRVWSNYNLVNPNHKAQEIGEQQFAKLCIAALGKPSCGDTDELVGRVVIVGLGFEKNDPTRNRVKYASAATTAPAAVRPATRPAAAPAQAAAPASMPWKR